MTRKFVVLVAATVSLTGCAGAAIAPAQIEDVRSKQQVVDRAQDMVNELNNMQQQKLDSICGGEVSGRFSC